MEALNLQFIRTHHALSKLNTRQRSKLARMTVTLALITLNQLVCFAVPDLILILRPGTGQTVFYFMNLNKGCACEESMQKFRDFRDPKLNGATAGAEGIPSNHLRQKERQVGKNGTKVSLSKVEHTAVLA